MSFLKTYTVFESTFFDPVSFNLRINIKETVNKKYYTRNKRL